MSIPTDDRISLDPAERFDAPRGSGEGRRSRRFRFLGPALNVSRYLAGGYGKAFRYSAIKRGSATISNLATVVRSGPPISAAPPLRPDGTFDVDQMALQYGTTPDHIEALMALRRADTRNRAYLMFSFGCLSVAYFVWNQITSPWSPAAVVSALEFLPFCILFFLLSFRQGLMNWRLRTRRPGTAIEYLSTDDAFLPS